MSAPVSGLYAALSGVLIVALAFQVIRVRRKTATGLGDGGHDELRRAMRVHGNAIEYIPVCLLLLLLAELNGIQAPWLHAAGLLLIISRLAHARGLSKSAGISPGRFLGMVGTFTVIIGLAVLNLLAWIA